MRNNEPFHAIGWVKMKQLGCRSFSQYNQHVAVHERDFKWKAGKLFESVGDVIEPVEPVARRRGG